jgi:hypothetical protein
MTPDTCHQTSSNLATPHLTIPNHPFAFLLRNKAVDEKNNFANITLTTDAVRAQV